MQQVLFAIAYAIVSIGLTVELAALHRHMEGRVAQLVHEVLRHERRRNELIVAGLLLILVAGDVAMIGVICGWA